MSPIQNSDSHGIEMEQVTSTLKTEDGHGTEDGFGGNSQLPAVNVEVLSFTNAATAVERDLKQSGESYYVNQKLA